MAESLDPLSDRACRMTDAYNTGIEITEQLREGDSLLLSVADSSIQTEYLNDSYPEWHPAPHSFLGMVRLLIYREATGESYRALARYQELAGPLDLEHIPDESVLSRTWRKRFDDGVREFVQVAARFVIKQSHDREFSAPAVRPKAEIVDEVDLSTDDETAGCEFSDKQIYRTTRLARDHGFDEFDSGRAANATYEDTQFFELQTFMGMVNCGTSQGAARFQYRHGSDTSPHGDTHLRTIKQFAPGELIDGFDAVADRLLSVIESEASFRRPVTAAIDITTIPYYGDVEGMSMVSGTKDREVRAFKFATLSIIGQNIPLVLGVEPVRESSEWDQNPPNKIHRVVRRLVKRAQDHVPIETVLCDREFDSQQVYQTLSNLGVNYLIPKRINSTEREVIETMDDDEKEVAVETASVHVEAGSHQMRFVYVPSTKGEGTAVFTTNLRVGPEEAETVCRRYSRRWQIENEYKSIKHDFLAKTSSKDYRVRLFYFVFAVLLYNIWGLTDLLLKTNADGPMDYTPVLTAGECVEIVVSALIPPD